MNNSIVYYIVLCMQWDRTPVQLAVMNGHYKTVEYFIKQAKMDMTQFDMVYNISTLFCAFICV